MDAKWADAQNEGFWTETRIEAIGDETPPRAPEVREPRKKVYPVFNVADAEAIKERVRRERLTECYCVTSFYRKVGLFQAIARHQYFENVTLGIIMINAVWIAVDTDHNDSDTLLDADIGFVLADSMFFAYFSIELFIRFMAFESKANCRRDPWFVFDSCLVTLYAFDPFVIAVMAAASGGGGLGVLPTALLRLFRLARLSRLVRMLRSFPELMIMIKGMLTASASVGYTMGLLMVITYVFSIALVQLSDGQEFQESYFSSVPLGMYSLVIYGTFLDDLSVFCDAIRAESTFCLILVTLFVCLASMTVMNMLIGVLCEVIQGVAEEEKETIMVDFVKEKFLSIVEKLDSNNNRRISFLEFQKIIHIPEAIDALQTCNVDPLAMVDFAEDFFVEDGEPIELSFEEFMELVLNLRGGQTAQIKDLMALGKRFGRKFSECKSKMESIEDKIDKALSYVHA